MNSIVYAIPVAPQDVAAAGRAFESWKEHGCATAALIYGAETPAHCDHVFHVPAYLGWAKSVNRLAAEFPDCDWLVTGGADILPDPATTAQEIARECSIYFGGTFGVMQPTGDAYGALADRSAAVSPWIGREWRQRMYGGAGPLWPEYFHNYADAELAAVAERERAMWWRPDLTQYHDHWTRRQAAPPPHMEWAARDFRRAGYLFETRKLMNFPGSLPKGSSV